MSFLEWLSLASVCVLGAMSPGPSLAVVTSHTLRAGAAAGVEAAVAHGAGVALYAVAVVSGLALLITASPIVFSGIQWAGALFLFYLGVQSLRNAGSDDGSAHGDEGRARSPWLQGFSVAFLNPKLAVFFLALFSQFLDDSAPLAQKVIMVATVGTIDATWYSCISLLLARPAILPRLQAARVGIDRVFGILLIAVAASIALRPGAG